MHKRTDMDERANSSVFVIIYARMHHFISEKILEGSKFNKQAFVKLHIALPFLSS